MVMVMTVMVMVTTCGSCLIALIIFCLIMNTVSVISLLIAVLITVASCAVITVVPGPLSNVRSAVLSSQTGDIINLSSGLYHTCSASIMIDRAITITSNGMAVIDCNGTDTTVFKTATGCDGAVISSITITNATGAISHTVKFNITISNFTASYHTNAVSCNGCYMTIKNSTITKSKNSNVYVSANSQVTVVDSTLSWAIGEDDYYGKGMRGGDGDHV